MRIVHLDFETRSVCDLRKQGAHIYASHPTTDVLCLRWAIDDGPAYLWVLGDPSPTELFKLIEEGDAVFVAHNAPFEHLIWNLCCSKKYGWPPLSIYKMDCTSVRSYAMGLQGSLDGASKNVGLQYKKDMKGHRIMLQLCKPRNGPEEDCPDCLGSGVFSCDTEITCHCVLWWHVKDSTPQMDINEKYEKLYSYCGQDVVVERALDKRILSLSPSEKELWFLDQEINNRGVFVNLKAAKRAIEIVEIEKKRLTKIIRKITNNQVSTINATVALAQWVNNKGIETEGVAKDKILDLLETDLPQDVELALKTRQEAAKSSTAKLKALTLSANPEDNRVRGCFQFNGAASTGRWAGRRIQLQNLPRPEISQKQIEKVIDLLESDLSNEEILEHLFVFYKSPMSAIASSIRAMFCAEPGFKLIAADFSSIESRVLAWLAGDEKKLNIFRSHGKIYEYSASQIFGIPIEEIEKDSYERLVGKVAELALGFQGGAGAFLSMAKNHFIKVPEEQAESIKQRWREGHPRIKQFWYDLEGAAIQAVQNPGHTFKAGARGREIKFMTKGSFLFCRLPSGRVITYPYPKMREIVPPWEKKKQEENPDYQPEKKLALTYKQEVNKKFIRNAAYGGLLAENVTQATARDLLAEAMKRVDKAGYDIVMHIHDEIVTEVNNDFGSVEELERIMCELPKWAEGLPVQAGGWTGQRFRK